MTSSFTELVLNIVKGAEFRTKYAENVACKRIRGADFRNICPFGKNDNTVHFKFETENYSKTRYLN